MYLKAISTAFSAISALSSVGRALGASAVPAPEAAGEAPLMVSSVALRDSLPPVSFSRESLSMDTANFAAELRKRLSARGVDLSSEAVLTSDSQGTVRVANAHPDKAKIEAEFADDPALQQQYAAISMQASLLRVTDSQENFAADYARAGNDPAAIAGLVERQIAYNQAPFSMAVGKSGQTPLFGVAMRA